MSTDGPQPTTPNKPKQAWPSASDQDVVDHANRPGPAAGGALILVGGGSDPVPFITVLPGIRPAVVVAADSGLDLAHQMGLVVDHLVGDLDSVDPAALAEARARGTVVHRYEADKDATDFELALDLVVDLAQRWPAAPSGAWPIDVVGPGGGRLDHLFADIGALAASALQAFEVTAHFGNAVITVVGAGRVRTISGHRGDQVSLVPVHGPAFGVDTAGLRWPLAVGDLGAGTTRGVSNEMLDDTASISVTSGVVVAIQPGTVAADVARRSTPYDPSPSAGTDLGDQP